MLLGGGSPDPLRDKVKEVLDSKDLTTEQRRVEEILKATYPHPIIQPRQIKLSPPATVSDTNNRFRKRMARRVKKLYGYSRIVAARRTSDFSCGNLVCARFRRDKRMGVNPNCWRSVAIPDSFREIAPTLGRENSNSCRDGLLRCLLVQMRAP
jgi:hypothetical protein